MGTYYVKESVETVMRCFGMRLALGGVQGGHAIIAQQQAMEAAFRCVCRKPFIDLRPSRDGGDTWSRRLLHSGCGQKLAL